MINGTLHRGIKSHVSLLSETQGNTGGTFRVSAKSSNDALDISFPLAPVDSVLSLDAQTSNAPVTVNLHRTFEGEFRLQSTNAEPVVRNAEGVEDPTSTRRSRNVSWSRDRRGSVAGKVSWEPQTWRKLGDVNVKTSNTTGLVPMRWK